MGFMLNQMSGIERGNVFHKKCHSKNSMMALYGQLVCLNEVHLKLEEAWVLGEHGHPRLCDETNVVNGKQEHCS